MEQLPRLQLRLANLRELRELIRALRTLAASHVQEAQGTLPGIRSYTSAVEGAIAEAARLLTVRDEAIADVQRSERHVLIAVCSEHGFVGAFNERILERARQETQPGSEFIVVGHRGEMLAKERGLHIDEGMAMATHAGGILKVARNIADRLGDASSVVAVFATHERASTYEVVAQRILPLDPSRLRGSERTSPALHHIEPELLLIRLADEYLFGEVTRILAESFASENSARLRVMESADHNIEDKLAQVRQEVLRLRQESITSELLDIVTGSEAIIGNKSI